MSRNSTRSLAPSVCRALSLLVSVLAWSARVEALQVDFGLEQIVAGEASMLGAPVVGDLDGDGHLDLIVSSGPTSSEFVEAKGTDSYVAWYRNEPGVGLRGPQRPVARGFTTCDAGDVDGDGDLDLVVASTETGTVAWLEHLDGEARFWTEHVLIDDPALNPIVVSAQDLDGDGDADVLYGDSNSGTAWWLERFANSFSAPRLITDVHAASVSEVFAISDVFAADLDGDGDLDPVTSSFDVACGWQRNINGQGAFGAFQVISPVGGLAADVGDLDGDGDLDVVSWTSHGLRWDENTNGQGAFVKAQDIEDSNSGSLAQPSDVDGDGDLDLVFIQPTSHVFWIENMDGLGDFETFHLIDDSNKGTRHGLLADFDADGDDDVVVLAKGGEDWGVITFENIGGPPVFDAGVVVSIAVEEPAAVVPVDLDGDGDLDLVSCSGTGLDNGSGGTSMGRIHWFENLDGQGDLSAAHLVHAELHFAVHDVLACDLDGDGDVDLLAHKQHSWQPSVLSWFENLDGAGSFGGEQILSAGELSVRVGLTAYDVDEDGDIDPLVVDGSGAVVWFPNDGAGSFGASQVVSFLPNPSQFVRARDLNGDGHLDLLVLRSITFPGPAALWFRGDGSGALVGPFEITGNFERPSWVDVADLDGDGDLDPITGNRAGQYAVTWFANAGAHGDLGPPQGLWVAELGFDGDTQVAPGDLDRDGDVDLVVCARIGEGFYPPWDLVQIENADGLGGFGPTLPIDAVLSLGSDLRLADLDGDDDLDLAFAEGLDQVGWLENHGPWTDLGSALSGSWGEPRLSADGSLLGGQLVDLDLTHAAPDSQAWLVLGVSELSAPFKGGTLVPQPALLVGGLPVSADGTLPLSFAMPVGVGSGLELYVQLWMIDLAAPAGMSSSNGQLGEVP